MGTIDRFGLARILVRAGLYCAGALAMVPVAAAAFQEPRNLAAASRGATVATSSEVGRLKGKDHTGGATIDGKTSGGYWCTAFGSKPPHWLEVKLNGVQRFNEVILHVYERSNVLSCRVERWDGHAWALVAQAASAPRPAADKFSPEWEFSDAPAGIVRCRFPAVTCDRVRLYFQKDSSVRLREVELLESPDETAENQPAPPRLDRATPLARIAFGRRESPLPPGWLTVTAGTRYAPRQGIGWVGDGKRVDLDRRGGAIFARAGVAGWGGPGRLRLDLPAGRYVAALFTTDFVLPVRPFRVEGDGVEAGRPIATACPGAWEARRFHVEAGAKGVELTFRGETAWLIGALVIAPEANLNALLAEADRLEEELALGSPEWLQGRTIVPLPAPEETPVAERDRVRGYVLFTPELMDRIDPSTRPEADEIGRPLAIQATTGEAAVAPLAVLPLRPLFDMHLTSTDLAGPAGARIPASAIDVRVVHCWPQLDKTPAGRGKVQVVPELLEPQDRHPAVCAPSAATRQYWITIHVPEGVSPATYRGEVRFSAEGVPATTVPVELAVLPFRLQTPTEKTFFMYSLFEDLSDEEIRPLLRDMREHGMNSLAPDLVGVWGRRPEGKGLFDAEPLRRVLRLAKEAGFTRPMPWSAGGAVKGIEAPEGSEDWNRALAELLRQVRGVAQEVGGQEPLFYPVDEPFGHEDRLTLAERAMRVARQGRTLRTYCTPAEKDIARLGSLLDVRCYAIGSVSDVRDAAESTRKAGASFWWYTNAARELPDVRRYLSGVWFWSTGADGQGYWVYQSRWRSARAFQDLEGDAHAHDFAAYPDTDGPIPTIQWESIRMGIDDARYLYTLEAAIAAHRGTVRAASAEKFLAELRRSMAPSVNLPDKTCILYTCPWKPGDFTRLRREVVRHILALSKG